MAEKEKAIMHKTVILEIGPGSPQPFGVHECCDGFNFAVFSRHGSRVTLLFFDHPHDSEPCARFVLEPKYHRTGDVWHIRLHGIRHGQAYAWQVDGPYTPEQGQRFNVHKLLIDPHAPALGDTACWDFACKCGFEPNSPHRDLSFSDQEDSLYTAKALIVGRRFDWQGDLPLRHPWSETLIYETHVRGLTVHPTSGVRHPGTFAGLVEKIPYLQELGITAVELMPIQEFNERELTHANPISGERLRNYWGYSTVAFFAPKESYASRGNPCGQITEFKTLVRELHRAGIEVILDVVFNHTAEGDETGPTLNFRGLDNRVYYLLAENPRFYRNYSGCGNTLNCNHPIVRDYILDCLRYWALEMHVDGFRFDLASILGRDEDGRLLLNPPLLERIAEDPILSDVKLIAEA
ncbi:MAG: glycogen debranching enzyme, partial [Methylothermaceae bacterium]|nr:glycogen debranching enzyme [Methylothermaceae bacterium]